MYSADIHLAIESIDSNTNILYLNKHLIYSKNQNSPENIIILFTYYAERQTSTIT